MNHVSFAERFADPAGSPIRELFPYLGRPGIISFAGGYPSPGLFDAPGLAAATQQALGDGAGGLQYGPTEGSPALREALAALCTSRGIHRAAADVLVTTGSQQAFDLLVRVFIEPGDVVCVETPAYPAAIQALRLAGARILEVPVDADGLRIEVLEQLLADAAPHARPKLLYTVPTFSNPGGTTLSQPRRERLVRLALQHRFVVVEDDPYGELAFGDETTVPVFATGDAIVGAGAGAQNPVIYLASLSKTVAPALRIGWMIAPPDVLRRCAIAKQTADLCTSPLAQSIAAHYLNAGRYPAAVAKACAEYRRRMLAMTGALADLLGAELSFVAPRGGMFVWAESRIALDPKKLFEAAVDAGVLFVPGAAFYPGRPLASALNESVRPEPVEGPRTAWASTGSARTSTGEAQCSRAAKPHEPARPELVEGPYAARALTGSARTGGAGQQCLRLSYAAPDVEQIHEGVRRLARAFHSVR